MQFKPPIDNEKYRWTNNVKDKMIYYGISESLIKRITRFPKRKEEGIAPGTTAVMQPTSNKKKPQEIWVMYQQINQKSIRRPADKNQNSKTRPPGFEFRVPKIRIISAWRYPGVSPVGKKIPIPEEILQELNNLLE